MILASNLAKKYGGFIRLSVEQSFYIAGVSKQSIKSIKDDKFYTQYKEFNNPFFKNLIACAS